MIKDMTEAILRSEGWEPDPRHLERVWVIINDIPSGHWGSGGQPRCVRELVALFGLDPNSDRYKELPLGDQATAARLGLRGHEASRVGRSAHCLCQSRGWRDLGESRSCGHEACNAVGAVIRSRGRHHEARPWQVGLRRANGRSGWRWTPGTSALKCGFDRSAHRNVGIVHRGCSSS